MLNKRIIFCVLGIIISLPVFADNDQNQNVNINVNPEAAASIGNSQTRDVRLSKLRRVADKDAASAAVSSGKSYVSMAPDANNPDYWKQKNVETATINSSTTINDSPQLDPQEIQAQSSILKKMLEKRQKIPSGFTAVHFTEKNEQSDATSSKSGVIEKTAIALPGTVWYSTMLSGADSYVPGPVFAQIQEGPFAGGTAIGKFEVAPDGTHVILLFNSISNHDRTYAISAVALASGTKIPGLTGDIDHHIFTRFIIPAAADFLTEVTAALKEQEESVIVGESGIVVTHPKLSNQQLALMGAGGATKAFAKATKPIGVLRLPEVKIKPGQDFGFAILKPIQ